MARKQRKAPRGREVGDKRRQQLRDLVGYNNYYTSNDNNNNVWRQQESSARRQYSVGFSLLYNNCLFLLSVVFLGSYVFNRANLVLSYVLSLSASALLVMVTSLRA